MLTLVTARTRNAFDGTVNKEVLLPLSDDTGYRTVTATGLGPVKASVNSSENAIDAGSTYLSSRDGERNIVLTVELKPENVLGSTASTLRDKLYEVFMPKSEVEIELTTTEFGIWTIQGVVESAEPNPFSPDNLIQISILCQFPYFKGTDSPLIVFIPPTGDDFVIPYSGKVPIGFKVEATLASNHTTFSITPDPRSDPDSYLQFNKALLAGEKLEFSTDPQDRYAIYHQSDGQVLNGLGWFTGSLVLPQLLNGDNHFNSNDAAFTTGLTFTYETLYGGL